MYNERDKYSDELYWSDTLDEQLAYQYWLENAGELEEDSGA